MGMESRKIRYFTFLKALDFERCCLHHMRYEDDRLKVQKDALGNTCAVVSRILDSGETDMQWHRFVCRVHKKGNASMQVLIYAANSLERQERSRSGCVEEILFQQGLGIQEKKALLRPYLQKTESNTDDILLHDVSGRYLWFIVETTLQEGQDLEIERIKIYFPRRSWISYLPEIYQEHDKGQFLERYLAVFQTLYEALNEEIADVPYRIDVDCANRQYLEMLARWLGIAHSYMWTDGQLRSLLKHAVSLYKARGTRQAAAAFVQLYTNGAPVYVVENFQIADGKGEGGQLAKHLYGTDPYVFQVIVREQDVPSARAGRILAAVLQEIKPAHMELELVVLKPYIFLDRHSYLGINSVLGRYQNLLLNGSAALSFTVLGGVQRNG